MADPQFEIELGRMFDAPPVFADSDAFAALVEHRLDRGWGLRQTAIGAAGVAGGMIGVVQLLRSGLVPQFEAVSSRSAQIFTQEVTDLTSGAWLAGLPMGGEAIWMAAALGVMALGFALTRLTQEL